MSKVYNQDLGADLCLALELALGGPVLRADRLPGGDTCCVWRLLCEGGRTVVLKTRAGAPPGFFEAEAAGLALLAERGGVRVPEVVAEGEAARQSFLVLAYIPGAASAASLCAERFAEALAGLHAPAPGASGRVADNFIGPLPQDNAGADSWLAFFAARRMEPLRARIWDAGLGDSALDRGLSAALRALEKALPRVVTPALLHGDLWSGNVLAQAGGPVFIDPAVYFGHHEVDLAMIDLFGGFPAGFMALYQARRPLEAGHRQRRKLYQLYPLLVHLLRFGSTYRPAIDAIVRPYV